MQAGERRILWLFLAVLLVHLVLLAAGIEPWDSITKALLAPVLMAWVLTSDVPRRQLIMGALVGCFAGDVLLEIDGWFLAGMAAFAVAQICWISFFIRAMAASDVRPSPAVTAAYLVVFFAMLAFVWSGLDAALRVAVPIYALLLIGTAISASALDRRAAIGGALFATSDGLICLRIAQRIDADSPAISVLIMALYGAAILLLTAGSMRIASGRSRSNSCA